MSIQSICRYIFTTTFSLFVMFGTLPAFAQADTTDIDTTVEHKIVKPDSAGHQLCLGVDMVHLVANSIYSDRYGYEFAADYYMHKEYYLAAEAGWGGSTVNYPDLKYTTTNGFLKFGFNKCILTRDKPDDWDMMLMGLRVGVADVHRSSVSYTVLDSVWGNTPFQTVKAKNFPAVWAELTGGMRVEIARGLIAGWNLRGKFIMNGKSFRDLAPLYIAGYGKGDKTANFDFNLYISYGIRWERKNTVEPASKAEQPLTPKTPTGQGETKEK